MGVTSKILASFHPLTGLNDGSALARAGLILPFGTPSHAVVIDTFDTAHTRPAGEAYAQTVFT